MTQEAFLVFGMAGTAGYGHLGRIAGGTDSQEVQGQEKTVGESGNEPAFIMESIL